jgi:hypothetical protein
VLATLIWQFICLAMLECHRLLLAPVLLRWYSARFGDPQHDYAKFETFMLVSGYLIQTAIATLVTLLMIEWLQQAFRWRRVLLAFVLWEVAVLCVILAGYQLQLTWKLNQLGWFLFGPPDSMYTFRNLMLPRLLEWLVCTVPVGFVAAGLVVGRQSERVNLEKTV